MIVSVAVSVLALHSEMGVTAKDSEPDLAAFFTNDSFAKSLRLSFRPVLQTTPL